MTSVLVRAAALMLLPFGSAAVQAEPVATGGMGATSRATVQISLSVAPRLEVRRSSVVADGGAGGTQSFCIRSNSAIGSYSISASDASDGRAGELAGKQFAFDVQLPGAGAGTMPLSLAPGASATGLTAASEGECGSGRLVIRQAQMASGDRAIDRSGALLLIAPD